MDIVDPALEAYKDLPIGTIRYGTDGAEYQWRGWGWWYARPTEQQAEMARHRDVQFMAKTVYGQVATSIGATKAIAVGANSDGTTYGRYYIGPPSDATHFQITERPGSPLTLHLNISVALETDANLLKDPATMVALLNYAARQRLAYVDDLMRQGPVQIGPADPPEGGTAGS